MSNTDQSGRVIKFRAWDEQRKVMHENVQFIRSGTEGNDWIVFTSDRNHNFEEAMKNPHFAQQLKIMQFTGHQINGVDLYESDIVRVEENDEGVDPEDIMIWYVVTWIKEWCMFALLRVNDEYKEYLAGGANELDTTMFWTFPLDVEDAGSSKHYLCGNIFENSNLLNHV